MIYERKEDTHQGKKDLWGQLSAYGMYAIRYTVSYPLVRSVEAEGIYVCIAVDCPVRGLILPYTYSYRVLRGSGPFRWKRAYVPRPADVNGTRELSDGKLQTARQIGKLCKRR